MRQEEFQELRDWTLFEIARSQVYILVIQIESFKIKRLLFSLISSVEETGEFLIELLALLKKGIVATIFENYEF